MDNDVKKNLQELALLLNEVYKDLSQKRGVYQSGIDISSGIMRTRYGVIVPLKKYRIAYDNYDLQI